MEGGSIPGVQVKQAIAFFDGLIPILFDGSLDEQFVIQFFFEYVP